MYVNYNSKSENTIGYFKVEIQNALSPLYFDDYQRLSCISSAMHLVKILTAESQKNFNIYTILQNFYVLLKGDNWIKDYIFWELELFKTLGYDLDFKSIVDEKIIDNEKQYITKSVTEKRVIPGFLVEKNKSPENLKNLLKGLKLVSDYLEKSILKPNNLNHPLSRQQFINNLK